ncbi:large conductance mechanosensitive channel [Chitinophaga terrae (ex Kim and Jung 2007)]|jgi:large conductance mechanosensitive channel|uniref:Large-conductance mechanosensitive channel n=1 Tax=Chitinophaga terrae (ex Kim and Jung 2007) TaxID=408074 RepID=A0A1H4CN55_9BACT|nr:large conductance mechanosensitive channel protein MscL [Chitinophaga terrae (ex Kim and Jung 2007)]MDQ0105150.1 large conductance mechanosensitive channel [Chitinophaga terrae (ex Kim and Jung 2007)]GEP90340.1 large-conductance mechanosensitive channel [Chitinophaga terrae (ex Kim and Jung 2007)]SEA61757.1 large conductance mechanosensitive channel [Chitinophaga terrae (ex Kim and Jung 2007)]
MSFFKEFKEFAMRGNVMDLAVGVIIGGAFGKIVTSLVDNILMPIIGLFTQGRSFNDLFVQLDTSKEPVHSLADAKAKGVAVFAYGAFIQSVIDFLIIAFCIFLLVKFVNKLTQKKKEEPAAPEISSTDKLLIEIRDELKKKS